MVCFKPLFDWSTIFLGNLPIWLSGSLTKMSLKKQQPIFPEFGDLSSESKIGKLAIDGQPEKTKAWCAIFLAQLVFVISLNFKNMYTQFVSKRKIKTRQIICIVVSYI